MMWRYFVPVVVFAVLAGFFYRGLYLNPSAIESPLIGKPVPAFNLPSLTNPDATVGSEDLKGQMSLVNVWGTWCVECRREHGFLLDLARNGVPIYGLNLKDDRGSALEWLDRLGDPYVDSAFDADGTVAIDWGVYGAPETFLVDRDGTILYKHISVLTPAVWQQRFVPIIEKECGTLPCPLVGRE